MQPTKDVFERRLRRIDALSAEALGLGPRRVRKLQQLLKVLLVQVGDGNGKSVAKVATIAHHLGLARRATENAIRDAEQVGLLRRTNRTAAKRGKISNSYSIIWSHLNQLVNRPTDTHDPGPDGRTDGSPVVR